MRFWMLAVAGLLLLGGFLIVFGIYFFEEYSPLTHPVTDPSTAFWYPIGLVSMISGVTLTAGALLEVHVGRMDERTEETLKIVRTLNKKLYGNPEEEETTPSEAGKATTP